MRTERDIIVLIAGDAWMMGILRAAQQLELPDWWIGAGFVRSKVWDDLHAHADRTPLHDVDVIFFDRADLSEEREKEYEAALRAQRPDIPWSVKNQARMHLVNGEAPYTSSCDALARWPETATCVAVRIGSTGAVELLAPHGIEDLVAGVVRPSPLFIRDPAIYEERIRRKQWHLRWPMVRVLPRLKLQRDAS